MQHFEPITAEHRYKNEMMDHMRRQTESLIAIQNGLEQLAQLLKPKDAKPQPMQRKRRVAK